MLAHPWIRRLLALIASCSLLLSPSLFLSTGSAATAGWSTSGTAITDPSGAQFNITGINWYGFETTGMVAHGLYTKNYTYIIDEIAQYGYNTIRIPFSNQMWDNDPIPKPNTISACPSCQGTHARDIMALIINYAGSKGLHVILDNHRSEAGNSSEANGLWYNNSGGYSEQKWINDWTNILQWTNGVQQKQGSVDTIPVNHYASDGFPVVIGFDLRNEPHTPARTAYLKGATWGTGDGINPRSDPNPNPFAPACVANSNCVDWRLAAERAGDTILGLASSKGWDAPLIFVEGISAYPTASGSPAGGPYDNTWWGGNLLGVNGNASNPGAPVVLNAGGNASALGPTVSGQLVYSAHDYGPSVYQQSWFNSSTTYQSLVGVWNKFWAYINVPSGVSPTFSSSYTSYPWNHTGAASYSQAPVYMGEFGTGNNDSDVSSTTPGSQGQWFTDIVNFIKSSQPGGTGSGTGVTNLGWTYWALNTEDSYALLGNNYTGLANQNKEYSFLCAIQEGSFAVPQGTAPVSAAPAPWATSPAQGDVRCSHGPRPAGVVQDRLGFETESVSGI